MATSWSEVKSNSISFSRDWEDAKSESSESQTFWNEFFCVFGIRRRTVASFEEPVHSIKGTYNHIDLFWKGRLLVEQKSRGKDLGKAESQAFDYIQDLVREGREGEVPRFVLVSDFDRIAIHDLEPEGKEDGIHTLEFQLKDLPQHIRQFAFIRGEKPVRNNPEDPANEKAYDIMVQLHDALNEGGFSGHDLEQFLVRILFCLFMRQHQNRRLRHRASTSLLFSSFGYTREATTGKP